MCSQKTTCWCFKSFLLLAIGLSQLSVAQTNVVTKSSQQRIRTNHSVLLVDENPFFVRAIQHNGESFQYLKSLGFNTVQLPGPASSAQLDEAARTGIFLIAAPPASIYVESIDEQYDPVLAWSMGEKVAARDQQVVRRMVGEIKDADERRQRPVVANVWSHWNLISPLVDVVNIGPVAIATNYPAHKYSRFVKRSLDSAGKPIWADVQTELSSALKKQVAAFSGSRPTLPVEHQQLKFQLYEALAGGARGVRFLSRSRLDAQNPESELRAASLRWVLQHCQQIAPWVAGGLAESYPLASNNGLEVSSLRLAGSQIMLIQQVSGFEQWVSGDATPTDVKFLAPPGINQQTYLVNELGTTLLPDRRLGTTQQIQIPDCPFAAAILVSDDPTAVQIIGQGSSFDPGALQTRQSLVRQSVGYLELVEQQLAATQIGFPFLGTARQRTETLLRYAQQMLDGGNTEQALRLFEQADATLAAARRQLMENYKSSSSAHVSGPMLHHFGTVVDHIFTSQQLAQASWNPNSLTAGDFENLQQLAEAGWVNRRDDSAGVSSQVSLEKAAAVSGTYGLQLTVKSIDGSSVPQSASVWVESAEVDVKQGQLLRINGWVKISEMSSSENGLMISDSLGGPDLASRFQQSNGWQEFTIYRAAARNGKVRVKFTMTGIGVAMIDEVTIRTMDRKTAQLEANDGVNLSRWNSRNSKR